jgi:Alpha-tubulin suppressor and related RCC1 domain-containing proteins
VIDAENVVQVACGIFHTGFLNTKGQVFTMGGNSFGQLGLGNKKSTSVPEKVGSLDGTFITKIACGYHSAAICEKGQLFI